MTGLKKPGGSWMFLASMALISRSVLCAAESADGLVVTLSQAPEPGVTSPTLDVFGGQSLRVPLRVEGYATEPVDIRTAWVQKTFALVVPLPETVPVATSQTFAQGSERDLVTVLSLPVVRSVVHLELHFQVSVSGTEDWQPAGSCALRIYPRELEQALKTWAAQVDLRLDDADGRLRTFLDAHQIEWRDPKAPLSLPTRPVVTWTVLDASSEETDGDVPSVKRINRGDVHVVFAEDVKTIPKVVVQPHGAGTMVRVELPLLKRLDSDPVVQATFLEILKLINSNR